MTTPGWPASMGNEHRAGGDIGDGVPEISIALGFWCYHNRRVRRIHALIDELAATTPSSLGMVVYTISDLAHSRSLESRVREMNMQTSVGCYLSRSSGRVYAKRPPSPGPKECRALGSWAHCYAVPSATRRPGRRGRGKRPVTAILRAPSLHNVACIIRCLSSDSHVKHKRNWWGGFGVMKHCSYMG